MFPAYLIISTLVYNFDDRHNWFFLNLSAFLGYSITSILKLGYKAPRPYYVSDSIRAISCESGYGKPSGHALECSQLFLTLWFIYLYHYSKAKLTRIMCLSLTVVFILLIMLDRLYLGVHSLDQVIMGAYLGTTISISLNMLFYDGIKRGFKLIFNREEGYRKYAFPGIITMASVHIFNITMFILNNGSIEQYYEDDWSKNIESKCPGYPSTKLFTVPFIHLAATLLFLAYFVAMLYSSRKFASSTAAWQSDVSIKKKIIRLFLLLGLEVVCFLPDILIRTHNLMLNIALTKVVPALLMGILYSFIDKIAERLHLTGSSSPNKMNAMSNQPDDENLGKAIDIHA